MYTNIFSQACNVLINISSLSDWAMYRDALKPTYWLAKEGDKFDDVDRLYADRFIKKYDEINARYNNRV